MRLPYGKFLINCTFKTSAYIPLARVHLLVICNCRKAERCSLYSMWSYVQLKGSAVSVRRKGRADAQYNQKFLPHMLVQKNEQMSLFSTNLVNNYNPVHKKICFRSNISILLCFLSTCSRRTRLKKTIFLKCLT